MTRYGSEYLFSFNFLSIVADEHEFGASADIFAEACKAGGSKSKPQTAPPEKNPTKKGRRKKCPNVATSQVLNQYHAYC